jgi:hypothetical protein
MKAFFCLDRNVQRWTHTWVDSELGIDELDAGMWWGHVNVTPWRKASPSQTCGHIHSTARDCCRRGKHHLCTIKMWISQPWQKRTRLEQGLRVHHWSYCPWFKHFAKHSVGGKGQCYAAFWTLNSSLGLFSLFTPTSSGHHNDQSWYLDYHSTYNPQS